LWSIAKALHIPVDSRITELRSIPYTISYVIRKHLQIDNLSELPKEKRPPDSLIWDGYAEELEEWIDRVVYNNEPDGMDMIISDIEG
jgi:hypothetical protein